MPTPAMAAERAEAPARADAWEAESVVAAACVVELVAVIPP